MTQQQQRDPTTAELLVDMIRAQYVTNDLLREVISALRNDDLYCPPNLPWCPGGVRLTLSTIKSDKKTPEQQRDSFYHPLPKEQHHNVDGGNGSTFFATSHPVWRKDALTFEQAKARGLIAAESIEDQPFDDPPEGYEPPPPRTQADPVTGEVVAPGNPDAIVPQTVADLEGWALAAHGLARGQVIAHLGINFKKYMEMKPPQVARAQIKIIADMSQGGLGS